MVSSFNIFIIRFHCVVVLIFYLIYLSYFKSMYALRSAHFTSCAVYANDFQSIQ